MLRRTWLLLSLLAIALGAGAQTMPVDLEIGYRWLDLKGSDDVYRSQINERSGFLLRALTIASPDFRLDANDLGTGPAGSLRFEMNRSSLYRFTLRYRRADAFSAIPAFALGQHTFDRTRDLVDADFELLRWSKFKPFIGYTWNRYEGPGTTTYHVGQDEFRLLQDLSDTDRELRVGSAFELGNVTGQFTQGWRNFRGSESLTLAPGANAGNNPDPVLGRPITVDKITRSERTDADTPFTSFFATAQFSDVRLIASYSRFSADAEGSGGEDVTGALASFALSRFYNGITEHASSRARNDTWRGGGRAEVTLTPHVDVFVGLQREHRKLEGSALIDTLYLQSITFGGADPRDVEVILNSSNSLDRDEDVVNVALSAHSLGHFSIRAGVSQTTQDVTIAPDLSEIVVPGDNQGGTFNRSINTLNLDGAYMQAGLTLAASWKHDRADDPILRTDFLDRDRYRFRAQWKAPRFVRAGITAEETRQTNDRLDTGYDAAVRQYTGDIEVTPSESLSLRASASRLRSESSILFRLPQNFTTGISRNLEKGESIEGGATFSFKRLTFDGDFTHFENKGTLPFKINRGRARVTLQVHDQFGLAAEWARDKYSEAMTTDYEASRYGVFLTMRR